MQEKVLQLLEELINAQKKDLLQCGRELIPTLTFDDVLQPNDYPLLENHPFFRYEEGVLAGMQSVQSALFALFKEKDFS